MNYLKCLENNINCKKDFHKKGFKLVVLVGSFADFDSFEYAQVLAEHFDLLEINGVSIRIIGIGGKDSKKRFSDFTGFPEIFINSVEDNKIHNSLGLNDGNKFYCGGLLNLLLMCAGINSPGTLKEVFRGYLGDRKAKPIFSNDKTIKIGILPKFKGQLFRNFNHKNNLAPFELATFRLINMVEIIGSWRIYVGNTNFLPQRGGTFLFNAENELIYKFFPQSLLNYSETMEEPLKFLKLHNVI